MKTNHIQAAFARKRENEHIRTERTEAVDRYYAHWGKQTSKYENWTAPEYYKQAEDNLKKEKEMKEKEQKLNDRREKLRKLLEQEKIHYKEELQNLKYRPKSRNMSSDVMEKIDQNFKEQQNEKRRLDLEAKLYGRLRHGKEDGSLLYESKSNNQVLAKLNWLDKQIEDQVKRDEEDKITMERTLRMQEEIRKTEETHKTRQEIREKEIREIRALQEKHVEELKERENEAESLKSEAYQLQTVLEKIGEEIILLETVHKPIIEEFAYSNNLRNVKTIIRKHSEVFRNSLKSDIELLIRVDTICPNESSIKHLMAKLNHELETEVLNFSDIESMYESEAKINLKQHEEVWSRLNYQRRLELLNQLRELKNQYSSKYYENQIRQKELIDIRATHLSSIENSNKQLKLLIKEEEILSPRPLVIETPRSLKGQHLEPVHKVSDSFMHLNLDCLSGEKKVAESVSQPDTARSQDLGSGPKFGRKKIAWT
ncbi:trichoplein keratin filament-binding protein isoform X2 [Episyrphus balteatus]|nr:trichoplein keratin filament-binding protein isoform X2 [Episyrphus balteatus]XP_055851962.1 trichoplein keratin filament-binding protein isoform X2 [Episyrphus balteatus]XP_055851963.1 trichoplein keratin filament-binding protein isoform X2 [Episyrphus balteatus]XP_055851964.1 trichoplein keratin filament-binding protein isoform X2 [Episyrphus balteatus]XP_055851965.1 trichoplein keratin filament-binding protein isoform X2 [Episyrphus balteatus]